MLYEYYLITERWWSTSHQRIKCVPQLKQSRCVWQHRKPVPSWEPHPNQHLTDWRWTFCDRGSCIHSVEGTNEEDSLAMAMYLVNQRHRPQLNRCDEDMGLGTGFRIWNAASIDRDRAPVIIFADKIAIDLHYFCRSDKLFSLFHEIFIPISFFVSSVDPFEFPYPFHKLFLPFSFFVPSFGPFAPQSRFHFNLAKTFHASLYMRTMIFLSSCIVFNPDFLSTFPQTDDGVEAKKVFGQFLE